MVELDPQRSAIDNVLENLAGVENMALGRNSQEVHIDSFALELAH